MSQGTSSPSHGEQLARPLTARPRYTTNMRVSQYMTAKVVTARPADGARQTFFRMRELGIRHLPVVDDDHRLVGLISDRDLRRPGWVDEAPDLAHVYQLSDDLTVGDLMTTNVMVVHTYDPLHKAARIFVDRRFGALPVLDKDQALVGVLSPIDIIRAFEDAVPEDKR
ncbi:MAG TPA: CBS domain-containing protein [Nannocystaceae bacterium]|nr:CBS domain-containing protein [Nannocystaceae bacterium]